MTVTVGVSLKMYFGHRQALDWCADVADLARRHPAVAAGEVRLFVIPTFVQLVPALAILAGTGVEVGAQDVAAADSGPFTGEVSAAELAEIGVALAEIGHAERRRLFGETDEVVAAKTAAALRHGVEPVLCLGETAQTDAEAAASVVLAQLHSALADAPSSATRSSSGRSEPTSGFGPLTIAYEPVWAIGAAEPAPAAHIAEVCRTLRGEITAARPGSAVIYGGSAGPGLLTELGDAVDGLFLGRFAHDPAALAAVLDEAGARS